MRKRDIVIFDLQQDFINTLRRHLYRAIEEANWPFIAKERLSHLVKALTVDIEIVTQGTYVFLQIPATTTVAAVQLAIALTIRPSSHLP